MLRRFEIHNVVGIALVAFGFTVLFLRSDIAGVTEVLADSNFLGIPNALGVPLSDIVGLSIIAGGGLYLLAIPVRRLDRFWWHWFCASSIFGYIVPAFIFWAERGSGVAFVAYWIILLLCYGLIAYHHRYEVLPEAVIRLLPGGDDD